MVLGNWRSAKVGRNTAVGLISGLFGSLVGVGGAVISIPMLHYMGVPLRMAQGCSSAVVISAGLAGAVGYGRNDHVRWKDAVYMSISGMVFAAVGTRLGNKMNKNGLKRAFGIFLILMGPAIMLRPPVVPKDDATSLSCAETIVVVEEEEQSTDKEANIRREVKLACLGSLAGFLNGCFGIGGGMLTVPSLATFPEITHREILGTSLAACVLPAITSASLHNYHGTFMARTAMPLAAGAFVGSSIGSIGLAPVLPLSVLKGLFACLAMGFGGRTIKDTIIFRPKVP